MNAKILVANLNTVFLTFLIFGAFSSVLASDSGDYYPEDPDALPFDYYPENDPELSVGVCIQARDDCNDEAFDKYLTCERPALKLLSRFINGSDWPSCQEVLENQLESCDYVFHECIKRVRIQDGASYIRRLDGTIELR